ncbi:MAG: HlyD family secretion protein, partial [Deltaproteobacteria bacterium]|nr:HlyD family secretion protein [Deltaproteobacteria bacterium]
ADKIPGTVKTVNVRDNQKVKKNKLLLEIDPADYELQVNEAQANLDIRKSLLDQALRNKDRAESLSKRQAISQARYEDILTAYKVAQAQVEAAEAQLKIARLNLGYTKIYAPADGYVAEKSVEAGNQVMPGQALMAVVSSDMWIVANYKETKLKNVQPGQKVKIQIDAYPGKTFKGRVNSIQRGTGAAFSMFPPENATGSFVKIVQRIPVKIVFDGQPEKKYDFSIGMSASTEIKIR